MIKKIFKWYMTGILLTALGSMIIAMTVQAEEKAEIPEEIAEMAEEIGEQYNICPELLQAVAWKESRCRADAMNGDCTGLMQIAPKWHQERMERLGVTNLMNPWENMLTSADYLAELAERYEDVAVALMVYNGDSGAEEVLAGTGEISEYAEDILMLSAQLEEKNGK